MSSVVVPLIVQDQASAALRSAAASSAVFTAQAKAMTSATADAAKGTAKLAEGSDKLAGAIALVSPQAAAYLRDVSAMAKVGNVASTAAEGLGVSLGSMLAVAGPVAAAVAALGAAYLYLKDQLDAVEAANQRAAESASAWQKAAKDQAAIVRKTGDDYAVTTGAASSYDVELRNQTEALQKAREGERELLAARVASAGSLHTPELVAAKRALEEYDARTEMLTTQLEVSIRTKQANEQADKNAAAAAKAAADAARQQADAERDLRAEITKHVAKAAADRQMEQEANKLANEAEWASILARVEAEQGLNDQLSERVVLEAKWAKAREESNRAAQASRVSTVGAAITGGPQAGLNALGNAGPWGGLVVALAGMVTNMEDTLNGFEDFHEDFMKGLGEFPAVLARMLPALLVDGTKAAVQGIVDLLANLGSFIPDLTETLITELTDASMWEKAGTDFFNGFIKAQTIGQFQDDSGKFDAGKGLTHFLTGGLGDGLLKKARGYDTGTTYVPRTGTYLLHEGERVSASSGAQTGTMAQHQRGTGGGITVNVTGFVGSADQLARELRRATGRGLSYGVTS